MLKARYLKSILNLNSIGNLKPIGFIGDDLCCWRDKFFSSAIPAAATISAAPIFYPVRRVIN